MIDIKFIICTDSVGGIGTGDKEVPELLYQVPLDLSRFSSITKNGIVVMGNNTWKSLPVSPLKDRENWILSRSPCKNNQSSNQGYRYFLNVRNLLNFYLSDETYKNKSLYVIGGTEIYKYFATHSIYKHMISTVYWTRIDENEVDSEENVKRSGSILNTTTFHVPSYFDIDGTWKVVEEWKTSNVKGRRWNKQFQNYDEVVLKSISFITLRVSESASVQPVELQYLQLMKNVLENGHVRSTRNGEVISSFGGRIVIDLSNDSIPLLTTKKMAWKTVIKELLWFARGETDNRILQEQNVGIWNGNASREFLDSRNLQHLREGDLGPIYGFQWRHSGAEYTHCNDNYTNCGVDQLENVRMNLVNNPYSRRMIVSAWNPSDLDKMALPPCHILSQWYVDKNGKIWLQLYQRSGDMFLGVPFNIFSYSVLLKMMAKMVGREVGGMIHILGDMHIYKDHVNVVKQQLSRCCHESPKLFLTEEEREDWKDFKIEDFSIKDYTYESSLKAPMIA